MGLGVSGACPLEASAFSRAASTLKRASRIEQRDTLDQRASETRRNLLAIKGSIPGSRGSLVLVKEAVKKAKA